MAIVQLQATTSIHMESVREPVTHQSLRLVKYLSLINCINRRLVIYVENTEISKGRLRRAVTQIIT